MYNAPSRHSEVNLLLEVKFFKLVGTVCCTCYMVSIYSSCWLKFNNTFWDFLSQNLFYQIFKPNSLHNIMKQVRNVNTFSSSSVLGMKLSHLERKHFHSVLQRRVLSSQLMLSHKFLVTALSNCTYIRAKATSIHEQAITGFLYIDVTIQD